jgi:hypothetical protein
VSCSSQWKGGAFFVCPLEKIIPAQSYRWLKIGDHGIFSIWKVIQECCVLPWAYLDSRNGYLGQSVNIHVKELGYAVEGAIWVISRRIMQMFMVLERRERWIVSSLQDRIKKPTTSYYSFSSTARRFGTLVLFELHNRTQISINGAQRKFIRLI